MNLRELSDRYHLRLGESSVYPSSQDEEVFLRLNDAYLELQKITGCTWRPPQLVNLPADPTGSNQFNLSELLTLTSGATILDLHRVAWQGIPLYCWNKTYLDFVLQSGSGVSSYPCAYAFWVEMDAGVRKEYLSLYPKVTEGNSGDLYISFFERLPDLSEDSDVPGFEEIWHPLIADMAADQFLLDSGDQRFNLLRMQKTQDKIDQMKVHYFLRIREGETFYPQEPYRRRFYGD